MKRKITYLILSIIMIPFLAKSQYLPKDTLYGNVKRVKEKVIFLTKKENHQLLYYDDYGHSGFMGPESTILRFYNTWYSSDGCYYLNYDRYYDQNRKITKDNWFGKKDSLISSYRYLYDEKDRLISKIDSSDYSVNTKNHYFYEYGENKEYLVENIIYENLKSNFFSHNYKKYKDGKIIRSKRYDENGKIDEYIYHYNDYGKLTHRIYKNPDTWKKGEGKSWSYGVQDSIGIVYKDQIKVYDDKQRLIKSQNFSLFEDNNRQTPILTVETIYKYEGNNVTKTIQKYKENEIPIYRTYKYDKNSLIEQYCCSENISDARLIQKLTYQNGKISKLNYTEESFYTQKLETHKITFSYKYDINKNWIEIIKTVNGKDLYKWIREIEYYE